MRAHCHKDQGVDGFRDWDNLKRGRPVQQRQAQELHRQAGVDEGPCGIEELRQFQQALGSQYQLLVMTRMKPFFFIFKGPTAPRQIRLLKSNDHFDGCTSFPAFVNRSYYCVDCEGGSTPMIALIIPAKGLAALRVAALTVRIMRAVPGPRSIARCVTASFTVPTVNAIMWSPGNVNRSKPVSSVKPSSWSSPTDVTSVGTPTVLCVMSGC